MTIDKYTKFLLTLIAVGIIGINFHLFKGSVVKDALAETSIDDWRVVMGNKGIYVLRNYGKSICYISNYNIAAVRRMNSGTWEQDYGCE